MRRNIPSLDDGLDTEIVEGGKNFSHGERYELFDVNDYRFAAMICLESIFPYLSRKFVADGANFLVYVGEPSKATRERIGWYVVFYFLIFTALSSLLYREYHKDYNK